MATSNLTYPHTLTNGQTADADQVMANFDAVKTLVESTGFGTGNLTNSTAAYPIRFYLGDIAGSGSATRRIQMELDTTALEAQVCFESGSGTASLQATWNGGNLLAAALTQGTAATIATSSSFTTSTADAGDELVVTVTETAASGINDVQVTIWVKSEHQAS